MLLTTKYTMANRIPITPMTAAMIPPIITPLLVVLVVGSPVDAAARLAVVLELVLVFMRVDVCVTVTSLLVVTGA